MKICVVGLGYIGFPTACILAKVGHRVVGVDVNNQVISKLRNGGLHIVNEEGLQDLASEVLSSGALRVQSTIEEADAFIIAVPTPFRSDEHKEQHYLADLSYVEDAARSLIPFVKPGNLVVLESTVPPGTTESAVKQVMEAGGVPEGTLLFAHAPERVLPGKILHELVHNDRIVGGLTADATVRTVELYKSFVQGEVLATDAATAELVKLMENTFRDVNIALANEMAQVCESLGIDAWEAMALANRHPRVNYLNPGPGVGGHCIAVDPYFVIEAAPKLTSLIQAARKVNKDMPLHVLELFDKLTAGCNVKRVAVLGASYKANVGDDRESPALHIARLLASKGLQVVIHDPYIEKYDLPVTEVVEKADAILVLTDHDMYKDLQPQVVAEAVQQRLILDGRGCLDGEKWVESGFTFCQLGKGLYAEAESKDELNLGA